MKNKKIGKIPKMVIFWKNREIGENSEFWDFGGKWPKMGKTQKWEKRPKMVFF